MAIPIGWVCSCCGKRTRSSSKPTPIQLGKCTGNKAGIHKWIKTGN